MGGRVPAWVAMASLGFVANGAGAGELPRETAAEVDRIAGEFARTAGLPSLAVGIVDRDGLCHSFSTGMARVEDGTPATPDSLYRVGSLTKVFTATLLVQMRDAGEVALDDPLSKHLPAGTRVPSDPRGARAITLRHLVQHTSGLSRLPGSVSAAPADDPYGSTTGESLLADLGRARLESPTGSRFSYSNFGAALLGLALADAAGTPYEELLARRVLDPLGMDSTAFQPTDATRTRWTQGYAAGKPPAPLPDWPMGAIDPAGGLCSSVNDLSRFVAMNLRAGEADAPVIEPGSLAEMQTPSRLTSDAWREAVGLGWIVRHREGGDVVWHNGMTGNHASAVYMVPSRDGGVICLTNTARALDGLAWDLVGAVAGSGAGAQPAPAPPEVAAAAERIVAAFGDPAKADLGAIFAPAFLAQVPEERVRGILGMLAASLGPPRSHRLAPSDDPPGAWTATIETGRGRLAATFVLEPVEGGRVVYFVAKPL